MVPKWISQNLMVLRILIKTLQAGKDGQQLLPVPSKSDHYLFTFQLAYKFASRDRQKIRRSITSTYNMLKDRWEWCSYFIFVKQLSFKCPLVLPTAFFILWDEVISDVKGLPISSTCWSCLQQSGSLKMGAKIQQPLDFQIDCLLQH